MVGTSQFFSWYFDGLGGIGGWVIFLIFYIAAAVWHIYDSQTRELNVPGWRLGVLLPGLLLLPTLLYRFAGADTQTSLLRYKELFFYMGLLGGITPVMVAVGYWVTFRGLTGKQFASPPDPTPEPVLEPSPPPSVPEPVPEPQAAPARPMVNAWLIDSTTKQSHQLYVGDTRIGRSRSRNDIVVSHPTVSREHVLIREDEGHFTIYDRGAASGILLNGRRVGAPEMLAHGDIIVIGDVEFKFTKP